MLSGFFRALQGPRNQSVRDSFAGSCTAIFLHGRSDFAIRVAGSARHQALLRELVPASVREGRPHSCLAALILGEESGAGRTGERGAVIVAIADRIVGYCPAYLATRYREWLHEWRLETAKVQCRAIVYATPDKPGGTLQFVVKLDVEQPFKLTTLQPGPAPEF